MYYIILASSCPALVSVTCRSLGINFEIEPCAAADFWWSRAAADNLSHFGVLNYFLAVFMFCKICHKWLPQCKIKVNISCQQVVPMSGLQNLISFHEFCLKFLVVQKVKIFNLLVLTFTLVWIYMTIITVPFFAHWTCSLISMLWCCCMGGNVWECRSLTSFSGRTRFPLFFNAFP